MIKDILTIILGVFLIIIVIIIFDYYNESHEIIFYCSMGLVYHIILRMLRKK